MAVSREWWMERFAMRKIVIICSVLFSGCMTSSKRQVLEGKPAAEQAVCVQLVYRIDFPDSKQPVEVKGFSKKVMSGALKHYGIDTECEVPVYHIDVLYSHVKADSLWVEVPWAAVSFISFGLIPYKSEVEVVVEARDLKLMVSSHVETSVRTDFSAYKVRDIYELDSLAQERMGGSHKLEIQASLIAESIFDVIGKSKSMTP